MILYLVGRSCVGKTTVGRLLAEEVGFQHFDLDTEVENYYQKPIERIQDECLTMNGYREKASVVLGNLLSMDDDLVISGPPSGLMFSYLRVYKKYKTKKVLHSIYLKDSCENVLERLRFYDEDSNPIEMELDEKMKKRYLRKLKGDYHYFKDSYARADFTVDINRVPLNEIPALVTRELQKTIKLPQKELR